MIKHALLLCIIFYSAITVESFTQTVSLKFKGLRRGLEMCLCKRKPDSKT